MGDLPSLAKSIATHGLLHPIVVSPTYDLIAGHRRLKAYQILAEEDAKYAMIPCLILDLDELGKLQAEHDENEMRKPFTPSERVTIMRRIEEKLQAAKFCHGRVKDEAARQAGFGNRETARQAEMVADSGSEMLVDAVDNGEISISDAASVADKPAEVQDRAVDDVRAGKAKTVREASERQQPSTEPDYRVLKADGYKAISSLARVCDGLQLTRHTIAGHHVPAILQELKDLIRATA